MGDLEYALADILRVQKKFDEYTERIQRLAKRFPGHPRSAGAKLETVKARMADVLSLSRDILIETDVARRAVQTRERDRVFNEEVDKVLETSIVALNEDIRQQIEALYASDRYWPERLIQINPHLL